MSRQAHNLENKGFDSLPRYHLVHIGREHMGDTITDETGQIVLSFDRLTGMLCMYDKDSNEWVEGYFDLMELTEMVRTLTGEM